MKTGVLFIFLFNLCFAVNRNDFKTCDQSAFCKRHRAITENTGYSVVEQSVSQQTSSLVVGKIRNTDNTLELRVYGLESSVRIQIDETQDAIRKRFVPTFALNGEPKQASFASVKIESSSTTLLTQNKKTKVVVNYNPFVVDIYNEFDELVGQVNRDGKLKVEEYRNRDDGKEYPEGFWEESFKQFKDSKPFGSSSVGVDVSFVGFRTAYGLPEHADSFALKSTVGNTDPYRLYNLDVFEYEVNNPMALYVAIPYIVAHKASRTVGALWLNAAETWIDTSSSASSRGMFRSLVDKVVSGDTIPHFDAHFISESGLVDIFFFTGPNPLDVQKGLAEITGVAPLPPMFAIAYHQCRWNYNDEQDVAQVNEKFDVYDIPMDVIWLDIEHTDGKRYFTWDKNKFPHPDDMISKVASKGRKMVTIVDPHIKKDDGYSVYKDAKDLGLFVKKSDGTTDFEGHCWPGASEYLDFLHPETRKYWINQFKFDRYVGSSPNLFIWNDMNEPSVFSGPEITMDKDSIHYGNIEHREVHNMYGLYYHSATFEGLIQRTGGRDRPFLLTRSGFVGTQRSAAIWTGDNTAEWSHLAISIPMLLSLSVAGNPFVGADVGGFFGNPDEQLITRWYQAGAFQPFFRAHAHIDARRREPWVFSDDTRERIKTAIRRRYALLPYWYSLFREHAQTGAPVMRPLWYEFPEDESFLEEERSYMLGNALLVHPIVDKDTYNANVVLPAGSDKSTKWYDWETGVLRTHGSQYVDAPINSIPVFQRGGTIVPTWQRIRRAASLMLKDPFTLYVALDDQGSASGNIYIDDGTTHDYQQNSYASASVDFRTLSAKEATIFGVPTGGSFEAMNWIEKIEVRGLTKEPQDISIIRSSDPTEKLYFTYDRDMKSLTIRKPLVSVTQSYKITILF
ncbi:unnamed protein product [Auanema sp. JU1783]|nr:unnamed protein product [Auanema sp. JU1783]